MRLVWFVNSPLSSFYKDKYYFIFTQLKLKVSLLSRSYLMIKREIKLQETRLESFEKEDGQFSAKMLI